MAGKGAAAAKAKAKGGAEAAKRRPRPSVTDGLRGDGLLARPVSAPSARLLLQLEECSRIKAAFSRLGLACPMSAVERGLLLPEDRPMHDLQVALPRPGVRLVDPFYVPPQKKKKKRRKAPVPRFGSP